MDLIGVDGARQGQWVLATIKIGKLGALAFKLTHDLTDLFSRAFAGEALIVIDVPIGILSGAAAAAGRACDAQARKVVGSKRASSVFTPPCREAFGSRNQQEASGRNRFVCSRGLSCQAFGILPRIEAVDALMTPALQRQVREGHPEVTLATLNANVVQHPKKTREGREERLALLESENITFDLDAERRRLGRSLVSTDDIIDAAAMLVSARRIHDDDAECLGDSKRDARGLLMQMWA